MRITADRCTLRALEPSDLELLYLWENDPEVWRVSGTCAPLSRERLARFIEEQSYDIYATRQMRLVVDVEGVAVGSVDIFDFDPLNSRFGIGILIYSTDDRRKGYARSAIEAIKAYGRNILCINQIWATVAADNEPSIELFRSCGFEQSAHRRAWLRRTNGYVDEIEFQAIL